MSSQQGRGRQREEAYRATQHRGSPAHALSGPPMQALQQMSVAATSMPQSNGYHPNGSTSQQMLRCPLNARWCLQRSKHGTSCVAVGYVWHSCLTSWPYETSLCKAVHTWFKDSRFSKKEMQNLHSRYSGIGQVSVTVPSDKSNLAQA